MGRHASGKNNYSLSAGVWAILAAVVLLVSAIWFFVARSGTSGDNTEAQSCVSGDMQLPVAGESRAVAQKLVDAYAAENPVVRDYCVKPVLVDALTDAAVYIAPDSPLTSSALEQAKRSAAVSDPGNAASQEVGVVTSGNAVPREEIDPARVTYPVQQAPSVSVVAASTLADSAEAAAQALSAQRTPSVSEGLAKDGAIVAVAKDEAPDGTGFTSLGQNVVYQAVPLNQAGGVSENQSRAGQDFARWAAERFSGGDTADAAQPEAPEQVWAAASPTGPQQNVAGAADTLFLLDTSNAMAPYLGAAAEGIGVAARDVTAGGNSVALWNYSSPLNPGVTKGYRQNVDMTPNAEDVAVAAGRFLTGGQPQTREALGAAVDYAAGTGAPVRVVLITTGTADAGDDAAFTESLKQQLANVSVSVVHVGGGTTDTAVDGVAANNKTAADAAAVAEAVRGAARG